MADFPMAPKVPEGRIRLDLKEKSTTKSSNTLGKDAYLQLATVQRVDSKRMLVDLLTVSGEQTPFKSVPLSWGSAGARTFCGVVPQVNDTCVIGFAPKESGHTRQAYIVGWLIPGTAVGYDWVPEQPASPLEQPNTKADDDRLEGLFTRRRHKLHNFAPGSGLMSSAQGADLVLDESATLVNRRGNELVLRDQDQALVVRSLQQFHAGAGFRVYGGMVQRDATLIPTQMFSGSYDWAAYGQMTEDGVPADYTLLGEAAEDTLSPATVFQGEDSIVSGDLDPFSVLQRGLFINSDGEVYDELVQPDAVYGGKPIYRVSQNAASDSDRVNAVINDVPTFSEYRIEVAHTSDGTLPVTEQTDGVDVDRMPDAPPTSGDSLNVSDATPIVELVMGTVVGNDPIGSRDQYGIPLQAQIMKGGEFSPKIISAIGAPEEEQLAFMVRVRNPANPESPPAFWGITKGGALKSYFPGHGSSTAQEHYQSGKTLHLGSSAEGESFSVLADGVVSLTNQSTARASDNVGVELKSNEAGLVLYGGGVVNQSGNSAPPSNSDQAIAQSLEPSAAVKITSAQDTLIECPTGKAFIRAPNIVLDNAATITETASSNIVMNSGDAMSLSSNTLDVTCNGKSIHTYGGPKNSLPTNGALREVSFVGSPVTGCLGGAVDEQTILYGGRKEQQKLGKREIELLVGGVEISSMTTPSLVDLGCGSGFEARTGPPFVNVNMEAALAGASMNAIIPGTTVSMKAVAGMATVMGNMGVNTTSAARIGMAAPLVGVNVPGAPGGVLTDGCIDSLTGMPFLASGTIGTPTFRVGG